MSFETKINPKHLSGFLCSLDLHSSSYLIRWQTWHMLIPAELLLDIVGSIGVGVAVWSKNTQAWLYFCQHADLKWVTCPSAPCWDQRWLSVLSQVTAGHLLPCKTLQEPTRQSGLSRKNSSRWFMKPPEVVCFCQEIYIANGDKPWMTVNLKSMERWRVGTLP